MREEIIRACFPKDADRLIFRAVRDYPYNDHVWTAEIQNIVGEMIDEDGQRGTRANCRRRIFQRPQFVII